MSKPLWDEWVPDRAKSPESPRAKRAETLAERCAVLVQLWRRRAADSKIDWAFGKCAEHLQAALDAVKRKEQNE